MRRAHTSLTAEVPKYEVHTQNRITVQGRNSGKLSTFALWTPRVSSSRLAATPLFGLIWDQRRTPSLNLKLQNPNKGARLMTLGVGI